MLVIRHDCSIFCMKFMELFSRQVLLHNKISHRKIFNFCVKIANGMLMSST